MDFGCIDESGNKDNKSEISIPVVDANAYVDDTKSNRSRKHNQCFHIHRVCLRCILLILT